MHIRRQTAYWGSFILLALLITVTIGFLVSRQIAIKSAIQGCNPVYGLRPVQEPTEIHAELTILDRFYNDAWIPFEPLRLAWVVHMKGKWLLVGGPPPDPAYPGPFYWNRCTQIIDALTGEDKSSPIE